MNEGDDPESEALPPSDDPWELLGIERGANRKTIKRAHARLIRRFRPDRDPEAFQRVQAAFETAIRFAPKPAASERTAPARPLDPETLDPEALDPGSREDGVSPPLPPEAPDSPEPHASAPEDPATPSLETPVLELASPELGPDPVPSSAKGHRTPDAPAPNPEADSHSGKPEAWSKRPPSSRNISDLDWILEGLRRGARFEFEYLFELDPALVSGLAAARQTSWRYLRALPQRSLALQLHSRHVDALVLDFDTRSELDEIALLLRDDLESPEVEAHAWRLLVAAAWRAPEESHALATQLGLGLRPEGSLEELVHRYEEIRSIAPAWAKLCERVGPPPRLAHFVELGAALSYEEAHIRSLRLATDLGEGRERHLEFWTACLARGDAERRADEAPIFPFIWARTVDAMPEPMRAWTRDLGPSEQQAFRRRLAALEHEAGAAIRRRRRTYRLLQLLIVTLGLLSPLLGLSVPSWVIVLIGLAQLRLAWTYLDDPSPSEPRAIRRALTESSLDGELPIGALPALLHPPEGRASFFPGLAAVIDSDDAQILECASALGQWSRQLAAAEDDWHDEPEGDPNDEA